MHQYKVIIIGAGPAGIACAVQLKRYGIESIVIEKNEIGGLLINANLVENYPGFPEGIKGKELVELFKTQLNNAEISVIKENVLNVDYSDNFIIKTDKNIYYSEFLVIASGTKPKKLPVLNNLPEFKGRVYFEVNEIEQVRGKNIIVIGAGDAAFDYSINLSKYNAITILNRSNRKKCLPLLYERSLNIKNIKYIENISPVNMGISDDRLVITTNRSEYLKMDADILLVAIGRNPNLDFLDDNFVQLLDKLENRNLFFTGDVKNGNYRQTAISTGDGIKAAMMIYERAEK